MYRQGQQKRSSIFSRSVLCTNLGTVPLRERELLTNSAEGIWMTALSDLLAVDHDSGRHHQHSQKSSPDSHHTSASMTLRNYNSLYFYVFLFHGKINTLYSNIYIILRLHRILSEGKKHLFLVTRFSVLDSIQIKSYYKLKKRCLLS